MPRRVGTCLLGWVRNKWTKWLKDMYGVMVGSEPRGGSRGELGAVSIRFVDGRQRLVCYDKDGSGNAIALTR